VLTGCQGPGEGCGGTQVLELFQALLLLCGQVYVLQLSRVRVPAMRQQW
jgi:hypothetical protein